ncbi:HAD-IA family hydrolase [Cohaesibacter celericrescens]|uniref:HAD-IA family hydrolase n=1 Tax=Cohaesibacter celericrescens TaxID=2067669 RepID=UPI0035625849
MSKSFPFEACLFDLDGTLVDSIAAVTRAWSKLALRHGQDPEHVLHVIHGRPASESLKELLSFMDDEALQEEFLWLENLEATDTDGVIPIAGALGFLARLDALQIPWGIVTSGTQPIARPRIKAAGIPMPDVLVTANEIKKGKPDPEPYLLGAAQIKIDPQKCIVFEDAPAGITAGLAAQSTVIAISAAAGFTPTERVPSINNYDHLTIRQSDEGFYLEITQ